MTTQVKHFFDTIMHSIKIAIITVCFTSLAGCGDAAPSSVSKVAISHGVELVIVRVKDPGNHGRNLVEVNWLHFTGTRPADVSANEWLEKVKKEWEVPLSEEEAMQYARPVDPQLLKVANNAIESAEKMDVNLDRDYVVRGRNIRGKFFTASYSSSNLLSIVAEESPSLSGLFVDSILIDLKTGIPLHLDEVCSTSLLIKLKIDSIVTDRLSVCPQERINELGWPEPTEIFRDSEGHVLLKNAKWILTDSGLRVVLMKRIVGTECLGAFDFVIPYSELQGVFPSEWDVDVVALKQPSELQLPPASPTPPPKNNIRSSSSDKPDPENTQ